MAVQDEKMGLNPFAHETLPITDTATGLTAATYLTAIRAEIGVKTAPINMWGDGTDPTNTVGDPAQVGDRILLKSSAQIANFRAIRTTDVSAELAVTYFK